MSKRLSLLLVATLVAVTLPLLLGAGTPSKSTPPAAKVSKDVKYYNQGVQAQRRGDYERAVELYRKALRVNPDFPDALNNLGFSLRSIARGYMDDAMQSYDKALRLKRDHEQALEYQGELFLWRGELKKAKQNYEQLQRMNSREAAKLKKQLDRVLAQARELI